MPEASKLLVDFFGAHLKNAAFGGKKRAEWAPGSVIDDFFKELAKKGSPVLKNAAGKAFAPVLLAEMRAHYTCATPQEAIGYLPKIWSHLLRGEGAGIWKTEQLAEGFGILRENTPFDCFFTEGMLTGLLAELGGAGARIRHTDCRNDNKAARFCVYELVWMRKNAIRR